MGPKFLVSSLESRYVLALSITGTWINSSSMASETATQHSSPYATSKILYQLKRHPSESKVSCGHHGWMHGIVQGRTIQRSEIQQDNDCAWSAPRIGWTIFMVHGSCLPRRKQWKDKFVKCKKWSGCHSWLWQNITVVIFPCIWGLHSYFCMISAWWKSCGERLRHQYLVCRGKCCDPCGAPDQRWIK